MRNILKKIIKTPRRAFVFWISLFALIILCSLVEYFNTNGSIKYSLSFLELFGFLTFVCCATYYLIKPIERNRILYGKSSLAMFTCIFVIVTCTILSISGINHALSHFGENGWNAEPTNLVDWDTQLVKENDKVMLSKENDNFYIYKGEENSKESSYDEINNIWAILSQFSDPGNLPSARGGSRPFALFLALLGILCLSGLLLSSLVSFLSKRRENWQKGMIHYRPHRFLKWNLGLHRFVVIIGVNDQTVAIARQALARKDVDYVLIQTRQDVEKMRMRLDLGLTYEEENHIVFYYAERTSWEDIKLLHIEKAKEVYILGEDITYTNEEDHDAFNIECLSLISNYMEDEKIRKDRSKGEGRLKCNVAFEYQSTFTAFKATHIYKALDRYIEFVPFNVHELWAKKVLVDNFAIIPGREVGEVTVQRYKPLDGSGIKIDDDKTVHLVIMGMNQMGTAFAVQAALLAHYPNFSKNHKNKTTITFIDDQAIKEGDFFRGRFSSLFNISTYRTINLDKELLNDEPINPEFEQSEELNDRISHLVQNGEDLMDIKWEFIQGNVASKKVLDYLTTITGDKKKISTLTICFNHPQVSIATAMYLPSTVLRNAYQILVYQQNSFDVLNTVSTGDLDWKRYENMVPFGMIESSYSGDSFDSVLAKLEHYTYIGKKEPRENDTKEGKEKEDYKYELHKTFHNAPKKDISLIKNIEKKWEELGIVQKLANIDMVESIPTKLRSMGINYSGNVKSIEDFFNGPEETPIDFALRKHRFEMFAQSEHMRWMTERLLMGFRPLKIEEQEDILDAKLSSENKSSKKEEKKLTNRAHLDICSNERLEIVDEDMKYNDLDVIAFLPLVLRYSEWMTVMNYLHHSGNTDTQNVLSKLFGKENDLRYKFVKKQQRPQRAKNNDSIAAQLTSGKEIIENHNFWIADSPVTQSLWGEITGQEKKDWTQSADMPVVNISKNEIDDFLLILRKKTGLYFSLPSLREWKYAAMLSTDYLDHFDFGKYEKDGSTDKLEEKLKEYLCISTKKPIVSRKKSHNQKSNILPGVYDMLGNVWEWTRTTADEEKHKECYYFCGGSWHFKYKECDLYSKVPYWYSYWLPKLKSTDVGFRLIWKFDDEKLSKVIENEIKNLNSSKDKFDKEEAKREAIKQWFDEYQMVDIEEGIFMMGTENKDVSDKDGSKYPYPDPAAGDEETPHHYVRVSAFQICEVPVTQKLWNIVMGVNPKENPSQTIGDNYPQTNVSYRTIIDEFLPRLNKLTGKEYRLPTEAEWEYVAKGGHTAKFNQQLLNASKEIDPRKRRDKSASTELDKVLYNFGKSPYPLYSGSDIASEVAWFNQNSPQKVNQKSKKPCLNLSDNKPNVYDMSGNVWEWILDYYQSDMYDACVSCEDDRRKYLQPEENRGEPCYKIQGYISNPVCLDKSYSAHVFRGGSWCFDKISSRCTSVNFWIDTDEDDDLGFRLVLGSAVSLDEFRTKNIIYYWDFFKQRISKTLTS